MAGQFNIELLDSLGFPYMLAVPYKGQWVVFTTGGVASTWTGGSVDDLYRIASPNLEVLDLDAEPSPIGLATGSASVTLSTGFGIYSQPDETVLAYSMHTGASISGVTSFASDWNSVGIDALGLQVSDAGGNVPSIRAVCRDGGWATSASGGALPGKHTPFVAAARWIHTAKNLSLWVNGVQDGSATTTGDYKMAPTGFRVLHHAAMATQVHLLIFGAPSDEQMAALTDLQIWSERSQSGEWFDQDEWYFEAGGAGSVDLDADAAAQASASGALSVSVPLAGAGLSVATATGALSVSIPLAGAAQAQAAASGALDVTGDASLAATATATASASGGLTLTVPLSASAVAQALASAGLSQGVPLAGAASISASASGGLTLNVSLSGAAIAQAAAQAGLSVTGANDLAGAAQAQASASGALTHAVPLSAAAVTVASASGNLTQIVPLSGSAASASMATGGLDVSANLSATALAAALASAGLTVDQSSLEGAAGGEAAGTGTLTVRVNLSGDAVVQAVASGYLAGSGALVARDGFTVDVPARGFVAHVPLRDYRAVA